MSDIALPMLLLDLVPVLSTAAVVTLLALIGRWQRIQRHRPGVWVRPHPHPTARHEAGGTPSVPDGRLRRV